MKLDVELSNLTTPRQGKATCLFVDFYELTGSANVELLLTG